MRLSGTVKNAAWIIVCRMLQAVLSLVISMMTARYLGPSNYGTINYAAAVVAFAVPVMQLGFRSTLVREFVKNPDREGEILGTSLVLCSASALFCIIGVTAFVAAVNHGETETVTVCSLYSLNLIFQALEMTQYWYQAKLLSKYTSVVSLCAYVLVSAYKIVLLITEKSIYWFAVSQAADYCMIAAALLLIYKKTGKQKLSFSITAGRNMLAVSRHYIVSGMMVTVFSHIGSILLKFLMDEAAVGYYTAAVSCAGMAGFVFTAIIDSARPAILAAKGNNIRTYEKNMVRLYSVILYTTVFQALLLSLSADLVVQALYGGAYSAVAAPLRVLAWHGTFSYLGTVRNVWILAEKKQHYLWMINLIGAITNVVLNLLLIPVTGIVGAAAATVATQMVTNVFTGCFIKPVRENNRLMLKALNPRCLAEMIRDNIRRQASP